MLGVVQEVPNHLAYFKSLASSSHTASANPSLLNETLGCDSIVSLMSVVVIVPGRRFGYLSLAADEQQVDFGVSQAQVLGCQLVYPL